MKRPDAKVCLLSAAFVVATSSCAAERTTYVPEPRPGAPAYWESNVPAEEDAPRPSDVPGGSPDGGDAPPPPPEKYLWQDGTMLPPPPPMMEPPPSQVPLRDQLETPPLGGANDDFYENLTGGDKRKTPASEPTLP